MSNANCELATRYDYQQDTLAVIEFVMSFCGQLKRRPVPLLSMVDSTSNASQVYPQVSEVIESRSPKHIHKVLSNKSLPHLTHESRSSRADHLNKPTSQPAFTYRGLDEERGTLFWPLPHFVRQIHVGRLRGVRESLRLVSLWWRKFRYHYTACTVIAPTAPLRIETPH